MKKLLIILMILLTALPVFGKLTPAQCYKKSLGGNFTLPYAGTSTMRDAVPDGVWTIREGDIWWDTAGDVLYGYDGSSWAALNATGGAAYLYLTPSAEPDPNAEGMVWYDSSTDNLKYRNASQWVTLAASTSSTLDEAYSAGQGITVDAGAMTLTTTDAANNPAMSIVHVETGAYPAFEVSNAGTDPAIEITTSGAGADITGTSATWSISKVGLATFGGGGVWDTADVLFDATSAGKDIQWDDSAYMMHFLDTTILGFGGAADGAADISFAYEGTGDTLDITGSGKTIEIGATGNAGLDVKIWGLTGDYLVFDEDESAVKTTDYDFWFDNDSDVFFGTTKATGFVIDCDTAKTLDILAGANSDDFHLYIGKDQEGIDLGLYGTTAGAVALWDSSADAFWFNGADIAFGDADGLLFGDALGTGCFRVAEASDVLVINNVVDGTGTVAFGAADTGIDVAFYGGAGSGQMLWDETGNTNGALIFNNADIEMGDADLIQLGDGADLIISATGTTTTATMAAASTFVFADTDHSSSLFTFGTTAGNGLDVLFLGATANRYVDWDAGADTWNFGVDDDGPDVYFYGEASGAYMKWAEAASRLVFVGGSQISLNDAVELLIGTGASNAGDFKIFSTNGSTLTIDTVTASTGQVEFGVTDHGVDVKLWAATSAEGVLWDESDEALEFTGANIVMDANSTITATGLVQVDQVVTDAASYQVTAANSGKIHIIGQLAQNTQIKLPAEADGLNYEFWFCSPTIETHDHYLDTEDDGQEFVGNVVHLDTSDDSILAVYASASDSKLLLSNADGGTRVKITCDGEDWYVTGTVVSEASISKSARR